jgi:hypothetical protein
MPSLSIPSRWAFAGRWQLRQGFYRPGNYFFGAPGALPLFSVVTLSFSFRAALPKSEFG